MVNEDETSTTATRLDYLGGTHWQAPRHCVGSIGRC